MTGKHRLPSVDCRGELCSPDNVLSLKKAPKNAGVAIPPPPQRRLFPAARSLSKELGYTKIFDFAHPQTPLLIFDRSKNRLAEIKKSYIYNSLSV